MQVLDTIQTRFGGRLGSLLRKCIFSVLSRGPIPTHIAFIMDGNRRYARKHNLKGGCGYRVGLLALMNMLNYCSELGVKYVTVYALSIDDLKREPEEIQYVTDLIQEKIGELLEEGSMVNKCGARLHFIGNLNLLNESTRVAAEKAMEATANNNHIVVSICLAYTSTDEIVNAVQESYNEKRHQVQEVDSCIENDQKLEIKLSDIERHMYPSVIPEPDILIRTSGANCLSNFLLWQITNTYLYTLMALWPEISLWHLVWVILNFQRVQPTLDKNKKQL